MKNRIVNAGRHATIPLDFTLIYTYIPEWSSLSLSFDLSPLILLPAADDPLRQFGAAKTNEPNPLRPKNPLARSNRRFSFREHLAVFPNEPNPPTPAAPGIFPNLTPSPPTDKFHRRPPRPQHP
jgi:hypothetical protein